MAIDLHAAGVALGQQQQLIDERAEAAALVDDFAQQVLVFVDRAIAVERHFDRALDGGQRRAQLVGGVGDELAVAVQIVGDQVEKAIDRRRQLVQFVAGAADRQSLFHAARPQPIGGVNDLRERMRGPARQPEAAQRRDQHDQQRRRCIMTCVTLAISSSALAIDEPTRTVKAGRSGLCK